MNDLRVAIIGCGKIADQHAQQIRRIRGSRLVATCDRERLMAAQLAERFHAENSFDDVDRLLSEARPDVVHITTPPQSHFESALKSLAAGCHVYVEKPFSVNANEARAMLSMANDCRLKVTAGHNVQFSPEMVRMRELVRNGCLGGMPSHVESIFSYRLGDPSYVKALLGDKNHWVRALPGKLLHNLISHGIAKIAEFMEGSQVLTTAHAFTSKALCDIGETELVDELRVLLSDRCHTTAYFTFTTAITPPVQELRLFGPKGGIIVDNMHRTVIHMNQSNSDWKSYLNFFIPPVRTAQQYGRNMLRNMSGFLRADFHMDAGMKNLIEAFYACIRSDGAPPIPYREILLTATVMDEIFSQIDSRLRLSAVTP